MKLLNFRHTVLYRWDMLKLDTHLNGRYICVCWSSLDWCKVIK